jgi:hypothetical protein
VLRAPGVERASAQILYVTSRLAGHLHRAQSLKLGCPLSGQGLGVHTQQLF